MRDLRSAFSTAGYNSEEKYIHDLNVELLARLRERMAASHQSQTETSQGAREQVEPGGAVVIPFHPRAPDQEPESEGSRDAA